MKNNSNTFSEKFEKTISTAWMVAHSRAFSDIPFASEIFEVLDSSEAKIEKIKNTKLAPQIEARHKLLNHLILQNPHDQILELASGFSPRSLDLARNKKITYVEFDLPETIKEKKRIILDIVKDSPMKNIHLVAGNVLDIDSLLQATKHFNKNKPITIVNEGLLRYLNFEEKTIVAKNISHLLDIFGGMRITSDITLKSFMAYQDKQDEKHNSLIQSKTGINTRNNCFENEEQAQKFFKDLGFSIERHRFLEVADILVSPKKLQIEEKTLHEMIEIPVVYIMKQT